MRRWRRRRALGRRTGDASAEANLHAQCAAVEETGQGDAIIDVAALERERLFAAHPRLQENRSRSG